jgi:pimeloyl-ACP methyl ester carboxylesterase
MPERLVGTVSLSDNPPLAFTQSGAGRDVILIHGALVTREDMVLALSSSLEGEFRVTAFDRPGHGDSPRGVMTGSPWAQAATIRGAAERMGLKRPVVVGHSHGGAVALAYALQFPRDLVGVVALAPIAFPELRLEHVLFAPRGAGPLGQALNTLWAAGADPVLLPFLWRTMFAPQPIPARYEAVFPFEKAGSASQTEAEGQDALLLNLGLMSSALNYRRCETPVRIFGGDRDLVVNNAVHGRLAAAVLPNGRYEGLSGLGHMLHHFAQPRIAGAARELAARA